MRIERYLQPPAAAAGETAVRGRFAHPVLALGFRPFFLAAGLMGALWLPLWLGVYVAGLALPLGTDPISWHAHELVFGLAGAVLAGFLLTAARNWTRQPTPTRGPLAALVLLWTLGRVAMLIGDVLPAFVVALVDVAFLPVVALALSRPLLAAKNRRNYAFVAMLLALAAVNLAFHIGDASLHRAAINASVYLVILFIVVMGGRVIPSFTRNACPGAKVRTPRWLDWTAAVSTAALALAQLAQLGPPTHVIALVAGAANLARVAGWDTRATLDNPLLWVLHVGYAFVGLGFVLIGLAPWVSTFAGGAPIHALTVGALGTLVIGMMARVSLGHTGRPLVAPRAMTVAFTLMVLATLVRVVFPIASSALYVPALVASGSLFALAFILFVIVYAPILTRARVDGAPG